MLKPALVFFLFVALAHGHMTGVCLSRISDGRLQVAVEHWHGGTAVRAGASFAIRQGGLVASGPWQAPLACDCPDRNGCATSYHDCGCNGNGIWFAIVADPGFVPGNVQVQGINGGSVTAGCGSCTEVSGVTTATMPLPPPASTCFADICGDGIISGPEVCEIGGTCAPGYPPTTCGTCCVTGTPCCQTGNAVCRNTVVNLDNSGQATVTFGAIDNGSTLSADCPQPGYPQVTPSSVNCGHFPSTSVSLLVGPAGAAHGETCTATVTVNDPIPPQISCPSSIVRGTDTNQCHAAVSYSTPVGTDQCPGASTTRTAGQASGTNFGVGTTTNTFVVTDQASLTASCSFTVTVSDDQGPSISCPSSMTVAATGPSCTAPVTFTAPVGTDNCPGASTSQTAGLPSGSTFPLGPTTQTFQVTDATGRTASCSFTVTVTDGQSPSITCPSSISVNSDAGICGAVVTYTAPVGTDNCSGSSTALTAGLGSGSTFPVGSTTETYQVTDLGGRTASCSFTVTVTDNENPTIDGSNGSTPCPAPMTVNTDRSVCEAGVFYTTPVGTDNCPGASTALTGGIPTSGTFPLGSTTNSYTVTDAVGLTSSCSFAVTVVDNEDPVIDGSLGSTACPAPVTVNNTPGSCAATVSYTLPVGADACPGATTALTAGGASGSSFPVGTSTQTYMVTDAVGRSASCSFDVTVVDAERPTISCPSPITVNSDAGVCGATVFYAAPTTQDNCPGFTSGLTAGLGSGSVFPVGTTTDTYVVTDAAGLTATCSLTITVLDGESPTIDGTNGSTPCPPAISQSNDSGACQAVVTFTSPVGTDQCPGASTALTSGIASGGTFPLGVTQNEYTVTDAAGNSAQCFLTITIVDSEGPHIDGTNGSTGCPASFSVNSDAGQCGALVTYTDPVATDSCPGVSTSRTAGLASGSMFGVGATTQTFTATDSAGNTASCSFTITVLDADPPTIDGSNGSSPCPSTITANAATNTCQAAVSYATPVGTDQCPGESTAQTAGLASGSLFNVGTTVNTFVVTDASSNTASCSFNVVVVDAQPPSIDGSQGSTPCPAPITVNNDAGLCSAVVTYTAPVGTDSCAGASTALTAGLGSGAAFPAPGPTTETYVVTDAAGQTASCSFTVTVNDVDDPVMDGSNGSTACPAPVSVNTDAGVCHAAVTYTAANGVDQCGATTTLTAGLASGSNFPLGSTTNTFTAADSAGNAVSCSFTVTVTDNEDPVIDGTLGSTGCPAPIAVNNDAGRCGAVVTYTTPVGTDGCAGAVTTLASGLGSGGFFPVGTTTETYLVTDASGRTASCSFTVSVIDNEPPTLNSSDGFTPCMPPVVVGNDAGACSAVVNYAVPAGNDNCGTLTPTLVSGLGTGGTFPQFTSTETWTATDASGNSVTCSFDVVVEDREPPVISHSPAGVVQAFPGEPYNYVVSMTDNCSPDTFSHVSGPMPGDMSNTPTDPTSVLFQGVDMAGNTVQYEFHVQTIFVATGVPVPTYMYVPMGLDMATAAFPGDTHVTYQLRPIGGGQAVFESVRATLSDHVEFEGASQVLPGRWEFWMVGWPSANARYGQEFVLCASEHFCY